MRKQILILAFMAIGAFQANAQYRFWGLVGTNAQGNALVGSNSVIIGTATSAAVNNVIIGNNTGDLNTTGNGNVFVGQGTATANTSGYANAFFGTWTGGAHTTGFANTFLGQYCGIATNTGAHNTFAGQGSGNDNTSGGHNTFMGTGAGNGNTTGGSNAALGASSGFLSGNLFNATVIGANAKSNASNTVILGGTGASAVNVGIGTTTPLADLHSVTTGYENVIFSTTNSALSSNLNLNAGINNVNLFLNGNTNAGSYMPATGGAPAVPNANMAGLVTWQGEPLTIGVDGYEYNGAIRFNNMVANSVGSKSRTECMRINNTTGFVGIHTRQTGAGDPLALLHVNLSNPVNSNLNTLTQGIRFEGLPTAQHPDVIVIDAQGNLAKRRYPSGGSGTAWELTGNTITTTDFIGTLNNDDFRIHTNNTYRARFTKDGNFDLGTGNFAASTSNTSVAAGTNNIIDNATSVIAVGTDNEIHSSSYSAAFGESNLIDNNTTSSQATGLENEITDAHNSFIAGDYNTISQSNGVSAIGTSNQITNSTQLAALGGGHIVNNSFASVVTGEDNEMINAHGCFMGGGHSYSDGEYNILLGNSLRAETVPTTMPTNNLPWTNILIMGEQIHSDLNKSLSIGFTGNRTSVTTQRGMAVQLDPNALSTYTPTVNFEVDAAIAPSPGPQPLIGPAASNIRFHNLPPDPQGRMLPAVLIDPATGELFQSQNTYLKPGKGDSGAALDSMYKENEALKARVSQLESQLSTFDEKFAQLERSLNQICESGCAGLDNKHSDVLYQSIPNPTDNNARINYFLARNYSEASIVLYSMDGREVGTYTLNPAKGDGSVDVTLGDVSPGTYLYRLIVDGNPVAVKKIQKQ